MEPFTVTPTKKLITVAAALEGVLMVALVVMYLLVLEPESRKLWMVLAPFMLVGMVQAVVIIKSQSTKLMVTAEQLTLEQGVAAKTRQMINLEKVQDVSVEQGLFERMLNIGTITIQSAGQGQGVRLARIDAPAEVANKLLEYARAANRN